MRPILHHACWFVLLAGCGGKTAPVEALPEAATEPEIAAPEPVEDPFALPATEEADPFGTTTPAPEAPAEPGVSKEDAAYAKIENAAALLTTGRKADAQRAMDLLKQVTVSSPDLALAHYNLGLAYQQVGDTSGARRSYLAATNLDQALGDAWLNLGNLHLENDDMERALQTYKAGLRQQEDNMDLWVAIIATQRRLGMLDEAVEQARKALKVNSKSLNVYNNLGLVYVEQGRLDLAKFIYQRAMRQDGGDQHAFIRCNLGRVYQLQGFAVDARISYKEALELDPELVPAMLYLSEDHLDNRNFGDAVELLERANGLEPGSAGINMSLGIAYRGVARFDDAQKAYETALQLEPENPEPYLNLGILYGDYTKDYVAAVQAYTTYQEKGGIQAEAAAEYIAATEKEQKRIERLEARKKRMEEQRAKRAEQKRILEEQAAKDAEQAAKDAEEAARKAAEEAANPTPPAPPAPEGAAVEVEAPAEAPNSTGTTGEPEVLPGSAAEEPPAEAPAEAPAETPAEAPAEDNPWGVEGGQ